MELAPNTLFENMSQDTTIMCCCPECQLEDLTDLADKLVPDWDWLEANRTKPAAQLVAENFTANRISGHGKFQIIFDPLFLKEGHHLY